MVTCFTFDVMLIKKMSDSTPRVSIILPVYNAEKWLDECLTSILHQTFDGQMELCIYNDSSTDGSFAVISNYIKELHERNIKTVITENTTGSPKGCGFAKNQAIKSSHGEFLCFLDADDVMNKERILQQFQRAAKLSKQTIVGCKVTRKPENSTMRYTKWINSLTQEQLHLQIYTSNGPSVVMPTWFCHRSVFDKVGGFNEGGHGVPEDYIFFLKFMELNGKLCRVDEHLLMYRHHPEATTFAIKEECMWDLRLAAFQVHALSKWKAFTIWNAGKQGRRLYRDLSQENKEKVRCFCDVDVKKIKQGVYIYELSPEKVKPRIPVVHFSDAQKPFVICVKMDLTGGCFEENLASLNLAEGIDYFFFS